MKSRPIDRLFVAVMLLLLILPVLQMLFNLVPLDSVNEKRKHFEIPDFFGRLASGDVTLGGDISRWFDDRYGFRDLLIRTKNQIDYSLFGTSRRLVLGKDGWLFLRDHDDGLVAYEREGPRWEEKIEAKLVTIARFLRARGIRFIVVGVPDKGDAHPEFRAAESPWRPSATREDKLAERLESRPELIYLDAGKILRGSGDGRSHYWKTDIHYDWGAARIIVAALVHKIAEIEGVPAPAEPRVFAEVPYPVIGDLATILATLDPISELSYRYENQYTPDQDTSEGRWEKDPRRVEVPGTGSMPPFDFIYKTSPAALVGKFPPMVLFGNSFSDMYFNVGLQTYFTEFYRARNYARRFDISLRLLPPGTKYVVYQYFAPFLGTEVDDWDLGKLERDEEPPSTSVSAGEGSFQTGRGR